MFKKSLSFFFVLCVALLSTMSSPAAAAVAPIKDPNALIKDQLIHLDRLISATEESLTGQKALRKKIADYESIQSAYLLRPSDNELLFRMIKSAHTILKSIQETDLEHTFDPEFIKELKVLSKVANKQGIPKP